jgi:hypothetical protein
MNAFSVTLVRSLVELTAALRTGSGAGGASSAPLAAAGAYGHIQRVPEGSILGGQRWDPALLSRGNYIDAMLLLRRSAWRGYTPLEAWEDFDLNLQLAEAGLFLAHVRMGSGG